MEKREHRKGKRKLGYFVTQDNGVIIYVALKGHGEMDRGKAVSISEAKRSGKAGWSLDMTTLMKARSMGVKYVVVKLRRKKHLWVTRFENYQNPEIARLVAKGKIMSRILPIDQFTEIFKEIKL